MLYFKKRSEAREFAKRIGKSAIDTDGAKFTGEKHPTRRWAVKVV